MPLTNLANTQRYLLLLLRQVKDLTKLMLSRAGLPVPEGKLARSQQDAIAAAEELGYPVVAKPYDGNHGRGVTVELRSAEDVCWGYEQAREHSDIVIVERNFFGSDHRILVIGGEVVAVAQRVPACVMGDGQQTIRQLVEAINRDPRRVEGHESSLTRIEIDDCVARFLAQSGLTPDSVPDLPISIPRTR